MSETPASQLEINVINYINHHYVPNDNVSEIIYTNTSRFFERVFQVFPEEDFTEDKFAHWMFDMGYQTTILQGIGTAWMLSEKES